MLCRVKRGWVATLPHAAHIVPPLQTFWSDTPPGSLLLMQLLKRKPGTDARIGNLQSDVEEEFCPFPSPSLATESPTPLEMMGGCTSDPDAGR